MRLKPGFQRVHEDKSARAALYSLCVLRGQLPVPLPTVVFARPGSDNPPNLPMAEAWSSPTGSFVFLRESTDHWARLLETILAIEPNGFLVAWMDPRTRNTDSKPAVLALSKVSKGKRFARKNSRLGIRNLSLSFPAKTTVELVDDERSPTLRLSTPDPPKLLLGEAAAVLDDGKLEIRLDSGCLHFGVRPETNGSGPWLRVGLRIFESVTESESLRSYFYPAMGIPGGNGSFPVSLDPNRPTDADRTFVGIASAGDDEPRSLPSCFRTTVGEALELRPRPGCRLVPSLVPSALPADPGDPFELVPHGHFEVLRRSDTSRDPARLLCGLSGTESIELRPGDGLRFEVGSPALAVLDPEGARLESRASTAWVSLVGNGSEPPPRYFTQPEGSPFHGRATPGPATWLPFCEVAAGGLAPRDPSARAASATSYPLLPYAGVAEGFEDLRRLERTVIGPVRRDRIDGMLRKADPSAPLTVTTPRGLVAEVDPSTGSIQSVILARAAASPPLKLVDISPDLQAALLTDQHFIVHSKPPVFEPNWPPAGDGDEETAPSEILLVLDGWKFDFTPERWRERGTILLFKFKDGQSISDLVENPAAWTRPAAFNNRPELVSQRLHRIVEEAKRSDDPDLEAFHQEVLANPNFRGVLFLCCRVETNLPAELKALAAGIDSKRFFAHHLGIRRTSLSDIRDLDLAAPGRSELFGLIRYESPDDAPPRARDYDFSVRSLKALFEHSAVHRFDARIRLTANRFFGASVTADPDNTLELIGTEHRSDGIPVYRFTREWKNARVFRCDDAVLERLEISGADFRTLTGADGEPVGRFELRGTIAFRSVLGSRQPASEETPDLFGLDKLPFDRLGVKMTLDRKFSFDPTATRFRERSECLLRDGSLVRAFPVQPRSFLDGTSGGSPSRSGFLTAATPLSAGPIGKEWYGFVLDLDLGNPGALASVVSFTGHLGLFWSPSVTTPRFQMGVKLPGFTAGAYGFSIQDVVSLSVHAVQLVHKNGRFILRLDGLGISFLGLSFPRGSTPFGVTLFGDPQADKDVEPVLGWYGAYVRDGASQNAPSQSKEPGGIHGHEDSH